MVDIKEVVRMKNVAAYIRVSTDGQVGEDKFGLDVQRAAIEAYCAEHSMNIIQWFADEGESGAKERPGFDKIIYGDVANPPYEAVVVMKTDRVARDINVYFYYKMMLKKKDIELISITEDFGQFGMFSSVLEAFTLCVAEMERDNITKRTSSGRRAKADKGGYAGGRAPMGYEIKNSALVVNETEAVVVRKVFELRDEEALTYKEIVDILNAEGYRNRSGNEFSTSAVQSILNNRKTYKGFYKYGKDGVWVKGEHEALI